jgi:hypothetical protein
MSVCPACKRSLAQQASICLKCGVDLRPSPVLLFLTLGSVFVAGAAAWMSVPGHLL